MWLHSRSFPHVVACWPFHAIERSTLGRRTFSVAGPGVFQTSSETLTVMSLHSDSHRRHSSSTGISVFSALEVFAIMRYINPHFTYLLTYTNCSCRRRTSGDSGWPVRSGQDTPSRPANSTARAWVEGFRHFRKSSVAEATFTRRPASADRTARRQFQAIGQPVSRTQASDAMTSRCRTMRRSVYNAGASNAGRSLCVQISRKRSYPLTIYWYHSKGNWLRYNFAADSFYIMKLCSRLFVLYCRNCRNCPKDDKFSYPHFQEVRGGVEPWLMARWRARVEFLLSVIELLTVEALQSKMC